MPQITLAGELPRFLSVMLALPLLFGTLQEAEAQGYGIAARPAVGGYFDGVMPAAEPAEPTTWSTANAFPNLAFQNPMGVQPLPGTNRLLVWEREGMVYLIDNTPTAAVKTASINLTDRCQGWDDCGLLALATHPDFQNNHYVFVFYTYVTSGMVVGSPTARPPGQPALPAGSDPRSRLSRLTLDADGVAIPGSEKIFIDQAVKNTWHKGGGLFFHPANGLLYLSIGNDVVNANNQVINLDLAGGVIRIDVDKLGGTFSHAPPRQPTNGITFTAGVPNYFIPNDNPFVGTANALEEFYSIGLRSPHRMTVDPVSGRIFIGDVGETTWEEINVIAPADPGGLNFQWPLKEGTNGDLTGTFTGVSRKPLLSFPHAGGLALPQLNSIIGGYVYRGSQLSAQLGGKYIFGDNKSAKIYALDESTSPPTPVYLVTLPRSTGPNTGNQYDSISSFGADANNELYMTCLGATDGKIYKLVASGGGGGVSSLPLPATLSQTGLFSSIANLTPSDKLIPYSINSPFWSDGAVKSRWAVIPDTATVGFAPQGEWTFPAGSVFVKHFNLPVDDTNPAAVKRLETRILVKTAGGVYGATYKWREDLSDADLLTRSGLSENSAISTASSLGALTSQDIGSPATAGSTTRAGDDMTIVAGGTDIWGTSDKFRFCHLQRTGDFDLRMKVNSLVKTHASSKVCLMARTSLDANSQYASAIAYPLAGTRGYNMEYRTTAGGSAASVTPAQPTGYTFPRWLRLRREGNVFVALTGTDGVLWTEISRATIIMPSTVYFGVAVTAHTTSTTATTTASVHLERDTRLQSWSYPSRADCLTCHNPQAGEVLGLKTRQLNRPQLFPASGVTDNQIRAWNHVGLFSGAPQESAIPAMDQLAAVADTAATLQKRARSYFDSNCSHCHRPGGAAADWDARYDTPLADQGIINGSIHNDLGVTGSRLVTPQDILHSVMHSRINRTGQDQMPPLARNQIDTNGVAMLTAWINSLPAISLTGATDGAAYLNTDTLQLAANPSPAPGASVNRVEFWDNGSLLGQSSTGPFTFSLAGLLSPGQHRITARVYDDQGGMSPTSLYSLNVMPLELRFQGFNGAGAPMLQTRIPAGRGYTIEYTEDLIHWLPLQSATANGQSLDVQDPGAGTQRFYRLVVSP